MEREDRGQGHVDAQLSAAGCVKRTDDICPDTGSPWAVTHEESIRLLNWYQDELRKTRATRDRLATEKDQLLAGLLKYRKGEMWTLDESLSFNGLVSRLESERK